MDKLMVEIKWKWFYKFEFFNSLSSLALTLNFVNYRNRVIQIIAYCTYFVLSRYTDTDIYYEKSNIHTN